MIAAIQWSRTPVHHHTRTPKIHSSLHELDAIMYIVQTEPFGSACHDAGRVARLDCPVGTPMVYVGRCKTIFLAGSAGRQTIDVVGPYNGIDAGVGTGE